MNGIVSFPKQAIPKKEKTESWAKDCLDFAENIIVNDSTLRTCYSEKIANCNLINDIIDEKDIESSFNPLGLKFGNFPAKIQNYPIINPKIDLLVGEELKRNFRWSVKCVNTDALSTKKQKMRDAILQELQQDIANPNLSQEEITKKMSSISKYFNYEYSDFREKQAYRLLRYHELKQNFKLIFNQNWQDALIQGEEINGLDIINGEPIIERKDPRNIFYIRSGNSVNVEDSDIIIEYGYYSRSRVIDTFREYLTNTQIDTIEGNGSDFDMGVVRGLAVSKEISENPLYNRFVEQIDENEIRTFGGSFDDQGNVRLVRMVWKSLAKHGIRKYQDEYGIEQEELIDETYKPSKDEKIKWFWLPQWWECIKIASDIYIKARPWYNVYTMDDLKLSLHPYVGTLYNIGGNKAMSLMSRMKPYQYLYNIYKRRQELAIAKYKGPKLELNISKKPNDWSMDQWMYYQEVMDVIVVDPFNEINKGIAKGKLAGQFNTDGRVFNLDYGQFIMNLESILQSIKQEVGEISGVTLQRQGSIQNNELVGNVNRQMIQTSLITERLFSVHDFTKQRYLTSFLELCKIAYRGKNKKIQYIDDGLKNIIDTIDGNVFPESDYALFITDASNDLELMNMLKQLSLTALQNDKAKLSDIVNLYNEQSVSSIVKSIEKSEEDFNARQEEQQKAQLDAQKEIQQMLLQQKQIDNELAKYKIDSDYNKSIEVATISANAKLLDGDLNDNGIKDEIDIKKLELKREEIQKNIELKSKTLDEQIRKAKANEELKSRQISKKK